jgi:hypothetical protein
LAVGDAASQELGPLGDDRDRVGRLREESPELGMVPAEVLSGTVAMLSDASAQADHLMYELVTRELIEFGVGSCHSTMFALSSRPGRGRLIP